MKRYEYIVEVKIYDEDGIEYDTFQYHEEAMTAQGAVNRVRNYLPDREKIVYVYRKIENWE